jgi:ABC-type transport system substrate-binding protein
MTQPLLTRRRLIARASAVASAVPLLSAFACRQSATQNPQSSAAGQSARQPRRGGSLSYAGGAAGSNDTRGRTFDPQVQTQWSSKSYTLFYERLVGYNIRTYDVEPELAQKWEQPSQTEYVFHLQPGVKWQKKAPVNGRPLTSDDIVWTLQRARTDEPRFFSRSLLSLVDRIEAPDPTTIRLTTSGADASTLKKLSAENLGILARETIEKYPKPTTADSAVGTGPFIMQSVEENVGAEYVRNPDYWKPDLPYLDGIHVKAFSDQLTAWAAFTANQVDVALAPPSEIQKYSASQGPGFKPDWFADDTTYSFLAPNTRLKPMDDARITRALRLFVDHDEFISAWADTQYGRGTHGSVFPTALSAWDLAEDEYKQHLEWKQPKDDAAKEAIGLLNAAGFTKDNPLRFTLNGQNGSAGEAALQLLQAQWKRWSQGIVDVQVKSQTSAEFDVIRANRSFAYAHYGFSAGMSDPDVWLTSTYYRGGSLNFAGLDDPQVNAAIEKQRMMFDESQRKAEVKQLVLYMIDHAPTTFGANLFWLDAAQPRVQNHLPQNTLNGHQYQTVWLAS